ncbi:MAG TPA: NAD-dependent epimerase/dehydratase family protein [Rectinema sp.]|mgnify:FL=1|jgi:UDP-2-acetamido-2,6-beta-L-arabino-hexul-4-ose reductase|nr:NAD-dependent epimerase/dehydratase family protein [Spirochaetia bacterium]HNV36634.1 NAD-dependent epimerase/dehydratase family protein [Rectinema sp.]HPG96195.1 NAD-dependent epimerase/dehydratase family protein [Rectinema sp.]
MNVLVTGAAGFLGQNLCIRLSREKDCTVLPFDIANEESELFELLTKADRIVHLAGINRPLEPSEFMAGNFGLTSTIADALEKMQRPIPIIFSSSIQAELQNDYGKSKRAAEERLRVYNERTGAPVRIFRFANIFGKWCRPNYNSAVATFCYNIVHGLPLTIHDPGAPLQLVYIDDVVEAIVRELKAELESFAYVTAEPVYETTVGQVANLIRDIHEKRQKGFVGDYSDSFYKKLATTYLSYVDIPSLAAAPEMKSDERGWLFELIKSEKAGQIFVSTTKPGKVRGNHYHDTKVEKFCLVKGKARISLRKVNSTEHYAFDVDDTSIRIVDIPPGYTHAIQNTGTEDCIVLFWANEVMDPNRPDTYRLEV